MPLEPVGPLTGVGIWVANAMNQVRDVLTGVMTDQPVTLADGLTVKGGTVSSGGSSVYGGLTISSGNLTVSSGNLNVAGTITSSQTLTGSSGVVFSALSSAGAVTVGAAGALTTVAPGSSGNVLTSSGGVWASVTPVSTTPIYKELGVGTATINQAITSSATPGTDVTNLTATVTPDGVHDVKITLSLPDWNDVLASPRWLLQKDGVIINTTVGLGGGTNSTHSTHLDRTHTSSQSVYKISAFNNAAGATLNTINGDGTSPTNLLLVEQIG